MGGNFVQGLPAGPAGGVSRRGPAAGHPGTSQQLWMVMAKLYDPSGIVSVKVPPLQKCSPSRLAVICSQLAVFYAVAHSIKERQTQNEVQRKTHAAVRDMKMRMRLKVEVGHA